MPLGGPRAAERGPCECGCRIPAPLMYPHNKSVAESVAEGGDPVLVGVRGGGAPPAPFCMFLSHLLYIYLVLVLFK